VAYAAGDSALAVLEVLVHLEETSPLAAYTLVHASLPASCITTLAAAALPADWASYPVPTSTQQLGDRWVLRGASPALRVPSVVVPGAWNVVINPAHPRMRELRIEAAEPFRFDPRLMRRR
jgi:RES domain-containing protein